MFETLFTARLDTPLLKCWPTAAKGDLAALYPQSYRLDDEAYNAVRIAKSSVDMEDYFLLRMLQAPAAMPRYWRIDWSEGQVHELGSYPLNLENCIYAPEGEWGIYLTDEDVAVVSGPRNFLDALESNFGRGFDEQLDDLVNDKRIVVGDAALPYLRALLTRLRGVSEAESRLDAAGFSSR